MGGLERPETKACITRADLRVIHAGGAVTDVAVDGVAPGTRRRGEKGAATTAVRWRQGRRRVVEERRARRCRQGRRGDGVAVGGLARAFFIERARRRASKLPRAMSFFRAPDSPAPAGARQTGLRAKNCFFPHAISSAAIGDALRDFHMNYKLIYTDVF